VSVFRAEWTTAARAKGTVRYMQHRPDREGHRGHRELFGADGALEKIDAYELLDAAPRGAVPYKLVVAPSDAEDRGHDLDMRDLARETIEAISRQMGQPIRWAGSLHEDHSAHRHVHAVAVLPRKLNPQDLTAIREATSAEALAQRSIRDQVRHQTPSFGLERGIE